MLFLHDGSGNIVPLLRNAVGGFKETPYIGFAGMKYFSVGVRYLKSPDEISSTTLSSCNIFLRDNIFIKFFR